MKFGSLFTGIGGFDLGFERAGLDGVWQVEIDRDCNRVLKRHWPKVQKYDDVTTVREFAAVDVICGGFPCQDLSVAGKRAGLAGERSGLWFEFLRIIESNLPRWIVIENVPGLLSSASGADFSVIINGLVNVGYRVAWRVLDAQYFGVAQRRRRVFIVGSLGDGSCAEILFESESVPWNPPTRREARAGVANAVTTGTGKSSGPRNGNGEPLHLITSSLGEDGELARALTACKTATGRLDPNEQNFIIGSLQSHTKEHGHAMTSQQALEFGQLVVDQLAHHRFNCLSCGRWFGVNDYESNTVTCPKCGETHISKITDVLDGPEVVATLNSGGNSGGFRTEPGEHLIATAYRTAGNCGPFDQGDKTAALNTATDPNQTIVAFSSKDHGADAGELSPTLRAQNFDKSHINGGGQVAIAFHENKSGQLSEADVLGVRSSASHSYQGISGSFGVRRLTPRECERLQGFPDDWTLYDSEGKEISDSARYRMLGNAVEVDCAEWIGRRIVSLQGDMISK